MLAVGAIQFLGSWLGSSDVVFEYGAGRSTGWFGRHAGRVVSVESSRRWYDVVLKQTAGMANVELNLIDSVEDLAPVGGVSWDYVNRIKAYEPSTFHLVLNDGYARPLVALAAIPYVKEGGILAWDDWGGSFPIDGSRIPGGMKSGDQVHAMVLEFIKEVSGWRRAIFDDGTQSTALFFKPA
jgi:hypothetical protein